MKRLFSVLWILFILCPLALLAQGSYIPLGSETYHYLDRLEIKTGLVNEFHSSNKPFDRKIVMDYVGKVDTGDVDVELTDKDQDNVNYIYEDNFEFDTEEKIDRRDRAVWGFMFKHPANFMSTETPHFKVAVNPALYVRLGEEFSDKKFKYLTTKGFDIRGQIDKWVGFYLQFVSEQGVFPNYVNQFTNEYGVPPGVGYWKSYKKGGYDYFLTTGYVTFTPSKHIHFQFGYGNNFIGDGIRSMFVSDLANNYMFFKINTNVWKINYQNIFAELTSKYRNSAADTVLPKKYMAMHHLSINATHWLNIGIFEGVMFSRQNHFELQYLNPIIFYRSIEQALGSPDNAFIGFDFKTNFAHHVQIYGQLMLDEFNFAKEFSTPGKSKFYGLFHPRRWWGNKFAAQLGAKYIDAFGVDHLDLQIEANMARPYTYSHTTPVTSWSQYNLPLAHPLGANFTELIMNITYQPIQKVIVNARFIYSHYGEDNDTTNYGKNIFKPYGTFESEFDNHTGQGITAHQYYLDVVATYQPWHNIFVDLSYTFRKKNSEDPTRNLTTHFLNLGVRWSIMYRRNEF